MKVVAIILSNWYYLLFFPVIGFCLSIVFTHRIPDIYAAKCQILLKSNDTYDYQSEIYKGLGFNSKYASYEQTASQMRVIKSSSLLEEVMEIIPLNVSYFIVGRLKVSEVYKHLPFVVLADERSSANSGIRFALSIIDTSRFSLSYEFGGQERLNNYSFDELILDDGLFLRIDREPNLNGVSISSLSEIDYQFVVHKEQSLISKYQKSIQTSNIDFTSIVEITMEDEIPERAEEILDTLAKVYVHSTLDNKRQVNQNTLSYIDMQLDEVVEIINVIENELELYKENKEILNLSREEETYFSRLVEMDAEDRSLQNQIGALEDLTTYLLQEEDLESLLPPNFFVANTDPELTSQVKELYTLRSEYTNLLNTNTENSPRAQNLMDRISILKTDILRYIEKQKEAVKFAQGKLKLEIEEIERRIKNIPKTQRQILNIQRRLSVNEELYSFLLSKRAETVIARAGIVPETKIIEESRSIGIVYPDKTKMNLTALFFGLGLAVAVILIRQLFFQRIKSIGQLQTSTEVSILGSIPKQRDFSKTYRLLDGSERSDVSHAFRTLRTNLQFLVPTSKSKVVLITSLLPGEGKTFTSVNFASVLAIADKKVLLMDFDLHKPRLAKAMELDNSKGVSSVLIGKLKVEDVLQRTDVTTLDVITSGPIPPNASELILRKEFFDIMDYARENYEYIFLDTPPASLISDAIMLMKHADVKTFVLNSKSTSRTSIDFIEQLIENNKLENCTLILNEEQVSKIDYYYSRYGYGGYGYGGYGYGGYGQGPEEK